MGHRPGRELLTLVHGMVAGGDCIDDTDLLRCGATGRVLGHQVMAASTIGTWLIASTLAHNLICWVALLGVPTDRLTVAKTVRRRLLHIPRRFIRTA